MKTTGAALWLDVTVPSSRNPRVSAPLRLYVGPTALFVLKALGCQFLVTIWLEASSLRRRSPRNFLVPPRRVLASRLVFSWQPSGGSWWWTVSDLGISWSRQGGSWCSRLGFSWHRPGGSWWRTVSDLDAVSSVCGRIENETPGLRGLE